MGLIMKCCGMAVKRYVRGECEEDEGTDCEDGYSDINWLTQVDALCIKGMKLIVKYFFLTDALFFRSCLRFR
jgi:hypothetical protein